MGGEFRLGHRAALDGLRGIAVLLVVWHHSAGGLIGSRSYSFGSTGTVGVTLFLVLSGFLITRLLIEERDRMGRISLGGFYRRRAARLLPAFALFLAVVAVVMVLLGRSLEHVAGAGLYLSNLLLASGANLGLLMHTWSLSLEEQFYLVWPLLFVLARRRAFVAAGVMLAVAELWRLWLIGGDPSYLRLGFAPDTRAGALLAGCLLAFFIGRFRVHWLAAVASVGVLITGCAIFELEASPLLVFVSFASVVMVAWATTASPVVLQPRWLTAMGRISYGVYLWHYPLALALVPILPEWLAMPVVLVLSVAVARVSWRVVEQPVRRWINSDRTADSPSAASRELEPDQQLIRDPFVAALEVGDAEVR